jgi:hypothetical protein
VETNVTGTLEKLTRFGPFGAYKIEISKKNGLLFSPHFKRPNPRDWVDHYYQLRFHPNNLITFFSAGRAGLCWAVQPCAAFVYLPEDPGWHSFFFQKFGSGMYLFVLPCQSVKTGEHAEILSFFFAGECGTVAQKVSEFLSGFGWARSA